MFKGNFDYRLVLMWCSQNGKEPLVHMDSKGFLESIGSWSYFVPVSMLGLRSAWLISTAAPAVVVAVGYIGCRGLRWLPWVTLVAVVYVGCHGSKS